MHGTNSLKALILVRLQALLVVLNTLICKVSVTNLVLAYSVFLFVRVSMLCNLQSYGVFYCVSVCAVNGVSGLRVLLFY